MSDSQQPENRCRPSRVHWVTLSLASVSLVLIGYNSQRLLTVSPSDVSDGARTALPGCAAAGIQVPGLRESLSNTSWKPTPLGRIAICTYSSGKELNFGDDIGLPLVERMLGRRFQLPWINLAARRNGLQHCLLPIGSVLHFARAGDYGWSIGMLGEQKLRRKLPNNLTLHAIRGPETRRYLIQNGYGDVEGLPPVYGDAGMLVPCLFPEFKPHWPPKHDTCFVPQLREIRQGLNQSKYAGHVIKPTQDWKVVLSEIIECAFVISSSLHGVIIAEAYGIPTRLMLERSSEERLHKYKDYYSSTKRALQLAASYQEALTLGPMPPVVDFDYRALFDAFPWHLFPAMI